MTSPVVFAPEAEDHLDALYRYVASASSAVVGAGYVDAVITFCEELGMFPHRGTARDDIRPGLRTISYAKRTVIAFAILDEMVVVVGVFHGGRDYESVLRAADI